MHSHVFEALERAARNEGTPIEYRDARSLGECLPHVGPFPVLISDWISLQETTGPDTTSVYLLRLGVTDRDPPGIEEVSFVVPAGQRNLQRGPLIPLDDGTDMYQQVIWRSIGVDGGSRGASVAVCKEVLSP
jgi:hypothetical protein